ncbi:MAG: vitamin B12-dependent ribonucleotide reductase [bacterium]
MKTSRKTHLGMGNDALNLTENSLAVLRARYLRRDEKGELAETPEELIHRVAAAVATAETAYGADAARVDAVAGEFYRWMADGTFMPNSPTLMNAGREAGLLSACFVLPVEDTIDGIFSSIRNTALIQKAGGGTGFSFSRLRPRNDRVASSSGTTSGPISFMKVFSKATDAIQQGAFRRGANMGIMRIDHPDIVEFINAKQDLSELTNFNLSVGITEAFMRQWYANPSAGHIVRNPRNGVESNLAGPEGKDWTVGALFDLIIERAWRTGEPGVVFLDRINEDNPTPHIGTIEATNPCGEQPLLPYESCNLGSINVAKFVKEKAPEAGFDYDAFRQVIQVAMRFLDNVIDINRYPIPETAEISRNNRKIGLGIMGFADALFALGIPYDSEEGVTFAEQLMQFLNEESHRASVVLAGERGVFPNWKGSIWEPRGINMRNACTTTVAPTGTISIIANCSGGIEPLFSLVFFRNVMDGQRLLEVNSPFERVAREQKFFSKDLMKRIAEQGSIRAMSDLPEGVRRVFCTAHDIAPEWHIRMQAAFQKHCDASISKTINFPHDATVEEVRKIYLSAYEHRCKGVTVYRDGCRQNQPMALAAKKEEGQQKELPVSPISPMPLPEIMSAIRVKQVTPFGNMHIKIVVDPVAQREYEIFAQLGKGGDIACSDLEGMCRLISLYLRVNGSLDDIVAQLDGIGSSLSVPTKDGRIASLADGLAKAIKKYQRAKAISGLHALLLGQVDLSAIARGTKAGGGPAQTSGNGEELNGFKIKCPECGGAIIFEEGCTKCHGCGFSQC